MNNITSIIQPQKLEAVLAAITEQGYESINVTEIRYNDKIGHKVQYRGSSVEVHLLPKVKVEVLVAEDKTEQLVAAVVKAAQTGNPGDGQVQVYPVQEVIRIRDEAPLVA